MIIMNHNVPIAILTCRNETSNYLQHLKVLSLICWISCLLYHKPSGLRQTSLTFSNISLSTISKRVDTVFSPLPFDIPVSCQENNQFLIVKSKIQLSSISHCFLHRPERSGNWYNQITIGYPRLAKVILLLTSAVNQQCIQLLTHYATLY